jgi:hypothetical protein
MLSFPFDFAKIEQIAENSYSIYVARLATERWKGIGKYEKGRAVCRISKHTAQLNRHRGTAFPPSVIVTNQQKML